MKGLRHFAWICPVLAIALIYVLGIGLTVQIAHPYWYNPYIHSTVTPEELNDKHFVPMSKVHASLYPSSTSPSADFDLGYEEVKIPSHEVWINPRTQQEEPMNLRGWFISFHHAHNGIKNHERIVKLLKENGNTDEMITEKFLKYTEQEKLEGVVGIHGAGMDRRELLMHTISWLQHGYEVLLIDCRDHGISDGYHRGPSFGLREHEDAGAAVEYAKNSLHWRNVVIFGSSQGAVSSILTMNDILQARTEEKPETGVSCLILENPFASKHHLWKQAIYTIMSGKKFGKADMGEQDPVVYYLQKYVGKFVPDKLWDVLLSIVERHMGFSTKKLDPIDVVSKLDDVSVLYLHGTYDSVVPIEHSSLLFEKTSSKQKHLEIFPEGSHGILSIQFPEKYMKIVGKYLDDCHL